MPKPDSVSFRRVLGGFATGIAVLTCRDKTGRPVGVTINSFTSVSLEPPLVLFCLGHASKTYADFLQARQFAVNILSAAQEPVARHFAGRNSANWDEIQLSSKAVKKPPLLAGTLGWLLCRRQTVYAGGDHDILVGEVTALSKISELAPLLYFHGQYRRF